MTRAPELNIITEAEYSKRVHQGRYVIKGDVKAQGDRKKKKKDAQAVRCSNEDASVSDGNSIGCAPHSARRHP